ncbi:C39 family peptidase [Streptococcus iniae]|nr:cell wall anchor protein [Streptococcus iniae]
MNQAKIITGLAVATLSAVAGNVHAEDVTSTPSIYKPQVSSETAKTPEVTENQVADAKTIADKATSDVNNQQIVVDEAQKQKDQSQVNLVKATSTVTEAEKLATEATPEAIKDATEAVTGAKEAVTDAEANVKDAQDAEQKANQELQSQAKLVDANTKTVVDKESEVKQAEGAVSIAKESIDSTSANTNVTEAEKAVTEKQTELKTAEINLTEAQKQDAKIAEEKLLAEQEVVKKQLAVTDTQTLLNKLVTEINNEKVSTSLENQAYFNQRDGAWAGYYGSNTFAATGCVPTSLAMVFSELAKSQITPTEVANYLYNNTNYFNKYFSGTSANGIVAATQAFGFVPTHLASQTAIIDALQAGHYVVGAVQNNKFSPWGIGYSHEIVLRGYSNGNAYVYDPYNRLNIGWYPVASLWAERSGDKDDNAIGVPFFKITTQKMAELESQKAQLTSAVNSSKSQLEQAKQLLSNLQATPLLTSSAQAKLDQVKAELALAQDNYVKAQEAVKLASQELAVKEANLKNAQAELLVKQNILNEAQAILLKSQEQLADLEATLVNAKNKVTDAQDKLTSAQTILGQKQENLLDLQEAPNVLAKAQAKLLSAKAELANKTTILKEEIAKLKALQAVQAEAQKQYHVVFEAYKAVLDAKKQAELAEIYNQIIAGGGEAIPVVNETGKITGYVDDSKRALPKESLIATSSKAVTPVMESKGIEKSLPSTGEAGLSLLSVFGAGLISTLGLVGLKKRRTH